MMVFVALLQAAAVVPLPHVAADKDIVVVGPKVESGKASLAACIARACPPDQEITAALVLATREILAGDYAGARQTLLKSRSRNAKFEKAYPLPVSNLYRALNRVSNLDGQTDAARIAAFDATDALRAGLAADDPLILLQRLEAADQLVREGRIVSAGQIYDDVAAKARKRGNYGVEWEALFHGAALYIGLASIDSKYRSSARRWVKRIERKTEPEYAHYRDALVLLKAQIAARDKNPNKTRQADDSQSLPAVNTTILLNEPVVKFGGSRGGLSGVEGGNGQPEWADVAFWVRPDGSVGDLHIIGQSASRPGEWLATKTRAVAGRRYAPLRDIADPRGLYRVERYSMVYPLSLASRSRIAFRSARGILDTLDVTAAHPAPPPGGGQGAMVDG